MANRFCSKTLQHCSQLPRTYSPNFVTIWAFKYDCPSENWKITRFFVSKNKMAAHILLKNYTAPRIATTNMCAKFRDDLVPPGRPARFHYKQKKIQKNIQKNRQKSKHFFSPCCQIEGFTRFSRSFNKGSHNLVNTAV